MRIAVAVLLLASMAASAAQQVDVEGIFPDAAVLLIDGQRKMLRAGESFAGVTLLSAGADRVRLDVDGREVELGLSQRVGTQFVAPETREFSITRDGKAQYRTTALFNGRSTQVLLDTGASVVALSSILADRMGLSYRDAPLARVETASGVIEGWMVSLDTVEVGGIVVRNVQASVLEGDFPTVPLLGMSYLRYVDIRESNGVMTLMQAR